MKNKFIWNYGPISIELRELNNAAIENKEMETFELEDIQHELLIHTDFNEGAQLVIETGSSRRLTAVASMSLMRLSWLTSLAPGS